MDLKRKIPVAANIYTSNTIHFNRQQKMPQSIPYQYHASDRINNFQTQVQERRLISETYRAHDRNYSHPARTSPIMMTAGVHPKDLQIETEKAIIKQKTLQARTDFCLPE